MGRYFKKFIGEKCYLSPINIEDAEKYTRWLNDLEISINLGNARMLITQEREKEILQRLAKEGYTFAIIDLKKDELLGNCGLSDVDMVFRRGGFGIFIGNKEYWNKGYGQEATNLLLDFAFNILNLNNIMLGAYSFNKAAISCYEKIGFKEIGRRRKAVIVGGQEFDEILMDILAEEFHGQIPNHFKGKFNK